MGKYEYQHDNSKEVDPLLALFRMGHGHFNGPGTAREGQIRRKVG